MSTASVRISTPLLDKARKEATKKKQNISTVIENHLASGLNGGLIGVIKNDPEVFDGWKANIAMAVKNEFSRYRKDIEKRSISYSDMHIIANRAAEEFLKLLIK